MLRKLTFIVFRIEQELKVMNGLKTPSEILELTKAVHAGLRMDSVWLQFSSGCSMLVPDFLGWGSGGVPLASKA